MINLDTITQQVAETLKFSQEYPFDLNCRPLVEQWFRAKKYFIDLFGGNTIVRSSKPVSIHLTHMQKVNKVKSFIQELEDNNVLTDELRVFLTENMDGFFNNKVIAPCQSFGVQEGNKLSKSFKKFVQNPNTVRWMQDVASRYMQEDKIEGYLYLSVDPIDFLTISENNENWRSCHALDGDYRAGNLSYMVDNSTFIVYLASPKEQILDNIPVKWNSKKWRMLAHTKWGHCVYLNRQYPYSCDELVNQAAKLIEKYLPGFYTEPIECGFKIAHCTNKNFIFETLQMSLGGRVYDSEDIIDAQDYIGYCDLIDSGTYTTIAILNDEEFSSYINDIEHMSLEEETRRFRRIFSIKIGEPALCPCCGKEYICQQDSFLCDECIALYDADEDFFLSCQCCRKKLNSDGAYFLKDNCYCEKCYKEKIKWLEDEEITLGVQL